MKFLKFTEAKETYAIDWHKVLLNENNGNGDTIASSAWVISPSGLTKESDSVDTYNTRALIRISGGAVGVTYTLTNAITLTTTSDILVDEIQIEVK